MSDSKGSFSSQNYFPTTIFKMELESADDLNRHLLEATYKEREADQKGIARSNFTKLGGWHSHVNLHKMPEYAELVGHIDNTTDRISEELGYARSHDLAIGSMWSIINPPGSSNRAHVHPGALWSGVYYIQAPEGAGNIEFIEPRTMNLMNQPKYLPNTRRKRSCWSKVSYKPVPGKMIIFPSWLYHAVNPNLSEEDGDASNRIIISFNLNQKKVR